MHLSDRPIICTNLYCHWHARVMAALPQAILLLIFDGTDQRQNKQRCKGKTLNKTCSNFTKLTAQVEWRLGHRRSCQVKSNDYSDVIMSVVTSQITGVSIVYSIVCSGADQRKHQSSASLALMRAIHLWSVEIFPFDDVIMTAQGLCLSERLATYWMLGFTHISAT